MIRIFSQLRKKLLGGNQMSRYLLYGLGEILLVVIGILIALQVDTFNEQQKDQKKLNIAMQSLRNEIIQDSLLISKALTSYRVIDELNQKLMDRAYSSTATLDTLILIMREEFPIYWLSSLPFNQNTFDNMKSAGAFELLPEKIKRELSSYYTAIAGNKEVTDLHTDQYRTHLDDFVARYNIIGRIHYPKNYKNSYLSNANWENVDATDFVPRVAVMLGSYNVMYKREIDRLEKHRDRIRAILPLLNPYTEG